MENIQNITQYNITSVLDLSFSVRYYLVDEDFYTPRSNNGHVGISAICELVSGNKYVMKCVFPISDPEYLCKFPINRCGISIVADAKFSRGAFSLCVGDTIKNSAMKGTAELPAVMRLVNVTEDDMYGISATVETFSTKVNTYVRKITIEISKSAADFWFERYNKYRLQVSR